MSPAEADLKGWPIDLDDLYGRAGRRDRTRFHLREQLFESPGGERCLLLYHVGEIGIHKEVGRLAAYERKERPRRILDLGRTLFWYSGDDSAQWSADGSLAFVYECEATRRWLVSDSERFDIVLNVFDLPGRRRHRWDRRLEDLYRVRVEGGRVALGPHVVDLDAVEWTRL